jgi:hypothetical protein|tara:strand:- start:8816 stop:10477 length:1662 start_codon:yes stop_codon:yes gene_type:complete
MENTTTFIKYLYKVLLAFCLLLVVISCEGDNGCTNETVISTQDVDMNHPDFLEIIEGYNATYNNTSKASNNQIKTNVFVDLSDGITKFALKDQNNKKLLEQFFFGVQNEDNLSYYELSSDSVIKYSDTQALSYFTNTGHKDANGKLKQGAPIDKAFNIIAGDDDLGIVITDGELYDSKAKQVSMNPWASDALKQWFGKNGSLEIIYTDFSESNSGQTFNKHMYLMVFIPNNYSGNFISSLKKDLTSSGVQFKSDTYSTNVSDLYDRDSYPNAQTPGTIQLNTYGDTEGYFSDDNFEYINLTNIAEFNTSNDGIVYYLRDVGDENGKPFNYPIVEKLFIDLEAITNYDVKEVKINVSNVTEDFNRFKRNYYALKNKPKISKDETGKDMLTEDNYLIFDECSLVDIDGDYPYDTFQKVLKDTKEDYLNVLKANYNFELPKADNRLNDFIFIDNDAGMNNQANKQKFETVLKFDLKFDEDTKGFYAEKNNIIKVDVIVEREDFNLKPINRKSLTWDKIDRSGSDQTLFISLRNVLNNNKPNSILYTYYIELGQFNN